MVWLFAGEVLSEFARAILGCCCKGDARCLGVVSVSVRDYAFGSGVCCGRFRVARSWLTIKSDYCVFQVFLRGCFSARARAILQVKTK